MCGDADTGAVHQGHDGGDEAALPFADELGGDVVVDQLAGGRAVDAELVLEVADPDARAAFVQKEAQAAAVGDLRLASGEGQEYLSAPVGDESLDAGEPPLAVVVLPGAETDGLEVAAGVGFGQDHRAGHFAAGEPGQVLVFDLVAGKGVDGLSDAL